MQKIHYISFKNGSGGHMHMVCNTAIHI